MRRGVVHCLGRKAVRGGTALALLGLLTGCLIIPVNYHATGSRRNVGEETVATLQSDVTTREDVFLRLGEPDFASDDDTRLGYAWTRVKALIFLCGDSSPVELTSGRMLEISFNSRGRVAKVRVLKKWEGPVPQAKRDPGENLARPRSEAR